MPYAELLNKLITDKGLTIKEVADRCKENGQNITASYVSIIKNSDNKKIPSDDVSRALAKACEAENENCLVIEAYVDKAPEEFKVVLNLFRKSITQSIMLVFTNSVPEEQMNMVLSKLKTMPMYEFIVLASQIDKEQETTSSKLDNSLNISTTITSENMKIIAELKQPEGIKVNDSFMEPIIPYGCMVYPEILSLEDYNNGDILVVKFMGSKKSNVRKCIFNDINKSKITLFAFDPQVEPQILDVEEVQIIGKVKRIIIDL